MCYKQRAQFSHLQTWTLILLMSLEDKVLWDAFSIMTSGCWTPPVVQGHDPGAWTRVISHFNHLVASVLAGFCCLLLNSDVQKLRELKWSHYFVLFHHSNDFMFAISSRRYEGGWGGMPSPLLAKLLKSIPLVNLLHRKSGQFSK